MTGKLMWVFLSIGIFLEVIPIGGLFNHNLVFVKIVRLASEGFLDLGLFFIAINALYVNIKNKLYIAMAIEMGCCFAILTIDIVNGLNMVKGNVAAVVLMAIFLITWFFHRGVITKKQSGN
jgi:hypothetical protein